MVGYVVVWESADKLSDNFRYFETYDEAKEARDALNEDCEEGGYVIYKARFEQIGRTWNDVRSNENVQ